MRMPGKRQREVPGQQSIDDYRLAQVDVRLVLKESASLYSTESLSGPEQAARIMAEAMKDLDREMVCVVNMDNHLRPINYNAVSIGSLNASVVPVQNVFKSSILSNAGSIMLLHNHPSGEITPSSEDFEITRRLVEAGKLMDIPVIDHVIVGAGEGRRYSFREDQPDLFNGSPDLSFISRMTADRKGVSDMANAYPSEMITTKEPDISADVLRDYGQVKKNLFIRLCNAEKNAAALEAVPHRQEADLAMTYHVRIDLPEEGLGSVMVTNEMLRNFGVSEAQLHEDAMKNSPEMLPAKFAPIATILFGAPEEQAMTEGEIPMMVLTNEKQVYGASALFYPEQFEKMTEKLGGSCFILPSSVHEIIAVPDDGSLKAKELEQMVTEINASQLEPRDQLSDHVYHFDARERKFELAADYEARMAQKEQAKGKGSILRKLDEKKHEAGKHAPDRHHQKEKTAEEAL